LQNSPLESSCVVVALIENYSTSKPLNVSPEMSQIFIEHFILTLVIPMCIWTNKSESNSV